jgi:pimeloyl-ACP methyl ester carboxylesterase
MLAIHPIAAHTVLAAVLLSACGERGPATAGLSAILPSVQSVPEITRGASSVPRSEGRVPSLSAAPDQFLQVGDVTIRYRVIGDGPPMLLLHGYTDRVEMWSGPADSLARSHRVIVPDLRGFGKSTVPTRLDQYGKAMMWDLVALLNDLAVPRAHVVGYSMGGLLAAHLALDVPDRVASVTLVAGALFADSAEAYRDVAVWADTIEAGRGLAPFFRWALPTFPASAVHELSEQLMADNATDALVLALRAFPQMPLNWERVRNARVPAVMVVGSDDPLKPRSRALAERWPGAQYIEAPQANHGDIHLASETLQAIRHAVTQADPADSAPSRTPRKIGGT